MTHPLPRPDAGIIDHDAQLRHSLLGAYQLTTLFILCLSTLVSFLSSGGGKIDPRTLIPVFVIVIANVVQYLLWRKRKDSVVAYVLVGGFFLVSVIGTLHNGILAPSVVVPLMVTIMSGYLLGSRFAWRVGLASLAFLFVAFIAAKSGHIPRVSPPSAIWARVVGIQVIASLFSLTIPFRGLVSSVKLIDQERSALERSMAELEGRKELLSKEVEQRTHDLARANSDLAAFSYSLSHDLETPLRSIQGYVLNLESNPNLDPRQKSLLEKIKARSQALDLDIRQILLNSRATRDL